MLPEVHASPASPDSRPLNHYPSCSYNNGNHPPPSPPNKQKRHALPRVPRDTLGPRPALTQARLLAAHWPHHLRLPPPTPSPPLLVPPAPAPPPLRRRLHPLPLLRESVFSPLDEASSLRAPGARHLDAQHLHAARPRAVRRVGHSAYGAQAVPAVSVWAQV